MLFLFFFFFFAFFFFFSVAAYRRPRKQEVWSSTIKAKMDLVEKHQKETFSMIDRSWDEMRESLEVVSTTQDKASFVARMEPALKVPAAKSLPLAKSLHPELTNPVAGGMPHTPPLATQSSPPFSAPLPTPPSSLASSFQGLQSASASNLQGGGRAEVPETVSLDELLTSSSNETNSAAVLPASSEGPMAQLKRGDEVEKRKEDQYDLSNYPRPSRPKRPHLLDYERSCLEESIERWIDDKLRSHASIVSLLTCTEGMDFSSACQRCCTMFSSRDGSIERRHCGSHRIFYCAKTAD